MSGKRIQFKLQEFILIQPTGLECSSSENQEIVKIPKDQVSTLQLRGSIVCVC